eukprot:m.167467 g.167467  ORF g.167467 m.167467 type:complete len:84 (-) comp15305_c1_seq11:928-1179(-)
MGSSCVDSGTITTSSVDGIIIDGIQVVARAHRLGSRKPIVVQELIARGSVEEEMSRLKRTKDMLKLKHKERTIQMLQKVLPLK